MVPALHHLLTHTCWLFESELSGPDPDNITMQGTTLTIKWAELTLGKPQAKATKALAGIGSMGRGTGQTNKLLVSQDEFTGIRSLIPLTWLGALQQASNFNSPAGQDFVYKPSPSSFQRGKTHAEHA